MGKLQPQMVTLDVTANHSVQDAPQKFLRSLAPELKSHDCIKRLVLGRCNVTDDECETLASILEDNHVIEELDLPGNKITSAGAIKLALAIEVNKGLRTLNLDNQTLPHVLKGQQAKFDVACVNQFISLFNNNVTFTKLTWQTQTLDAQTASTLAQLVKRNVEIRARSEKDVDYTELLPEHMQEAPPNLAMAAPKRPPMKRMKSTHEMMIAHANSVAALLDCESSEV